MKMTRNPRTVHRPVAGYAHQVEVSGPQRWLVLSGQIGMDADGHVPSDPTDQFKLALGNIRANLLAADMDIGDIVKLTLLLVGDIAPEQRREILSTWLGEQQPAMTLLHVVALASPALKVEIDALACRDGD